MSLPEMRSFCQADPETRSDQILPGAHLPTKGFWIIKRPTAPSTAAAPSLAGRLKQTVSLSRALHTAPSLQRTSDGNI